MKLNPPETAPKDGTLILAKFGRRELEPAVWISRYREWKVSRFHKPKDWGDLPTFVCWEFEEDKLRGWLPLPNIDDEGNVK